MLSMNICPVCFQLDRYVTWWNAEYSDAVMRDVQGWPFYCTNCSETSANVSAEVGVAIILV